MLKNTLWFGGIAVMVVACGVAPHISVNTHTKASETTQQVVSTYAVVPATAEVQFPDQNVLLRPTVSASLSPAVLNAAGAYLIARDQAPLPYTSDASDIGTASLYSYTNVAAGDIQADGDVKLQYQGVPAWVFSFPLLHYVDFGVHGAVALPGSPGIAAPKHSACKWISIVDGTKGELIEAFESCLN